MEPITVFNIVGGLLVLALYSYGIVMAAAAIVERNMLQDRFLIDFYSRQTEPDDDVEWEEFDELDEEGEVVAQKFELVTNDQLEQRRTNKKTNKDNEDVDIEDD